MSVSQTSEKTGSAKEHKVRVHVNNQKVVLPKEHVTGLKIKKEAIKQGVEIELDFLLTLEAHLGEPARSIGDKEVVHATEHDRYTANDGDDDS